MTLDYLTDNFDAQNIDIKYFRDHPVVMRSRKEQLAFAFDLSDKKGHILEFGVFQGESITYLADLAPRRKLFGFDSFEGLPEPWHRSDTDTYEAGHFQLEAVPRVPENVSLIKGFFDQTVSKWLQENSGHISFLHIDCDLYSSASYVLETLSQRIVSGTVIVFDELSNWKPDGVYKNWEQGEWKALLEFLDRNDLRVKILSRDNAYSAAIQIVNEGDDELLLSSNYALGLWKHGFREEAVRLQEGILQGRNDISLLPLKSRYLGWKVILGRYEEVLKDIDQCLGASKLKTEYDDEYLSLYRVKSRALYCKKAFSEALIFTEMYTRNCTVDHRDWSALGNIHYVLQDYENALIAYQRAFAEQQNDGVRKRIKECEWRRKLCPEYRQLTFSSLILQEIIDRFDFETVLDIGSGDGAHAGIMAGHGKKVTRIDLGGSSYFKKSDTSDNLIIANFMDYKFSETFDCIWASHVLEHQLNVNAFLTKIRLTLRDGGVLAITVPPSKHEIVGGHLSIWNAGLLLYNLVIAGFDCSQAIVRTYGYNISVAVEKRNAQLPELVMDSGDINLISKYLPKGLSEGFNGELPDIN